ncbi:hypothetical protein AXJ14_gp139 [Geobacillus virus E3]|uniref:hypothetical protein n=1 Tax=Geobacillus virus E3 TaxID=1572712 RepID=UPI000671ADA0|nr:hypothetical protein AXJ14_gp139 [Geobacillus virus E3]AJA41458.1 hypothetical protein E3_0139 [Geobacillus virus E3]
MDLRTIDFLIATKVMEWEPIYDDGDLIGFVTEFGTLFFSDDDESEWSPTIDFMDAWQVVNKIKEKRFSIRERFIDELQKEVTPEETKNRGDLIDRGWIIFLLTPKSICLAALRAYGIDVDNIINNSDQEWFWTEEWQKEEHEVEEQIKDGHISKPMNIEEALNHLKHLKSKE